MKDLNLKENWFQKLITWKVLQLLLPPHSRHCFPPFLASFWWLRSFHRNWLFQNHLHRKVEKPNGASPKKETRPVKDQFQAQICIDRFYSTLTSMNYIQYLVHFSHTNSVVHLIDVSTQSNCLYPVNVNHFFPVSIDSMQCSHCLLTFLLLTPPEKSFWTKNFFKIFSNYILLLRLAWFGEKFACVLLYAIWNF